MGRNQKLELGAIFLVYFGLALANARTLMPWCDEAWFAGPAVSLVTRGYMGTPVLDPTAAWGIRDLRHIDRYTYWITPGFPFSLSLWFRVWPIHLFTVRAYSILWGAVTLSAWWVILRRLSGNIPVALAGVALLAIDFTFLWGAAVGRMDMMCAALGSGALAVYLTLREGHFRWAVLASNALIAAAALVHPLALGWCAALVALTLYYDHRRIRIPEVLLAGVGYLVAAAAWGSYIAQDPALWSAQFSANTGNRVLSGSLWANLHAQTIERYFWMFGLAPDTHGLSHLKIAALTIYAAGLVGALATPGIRRHPGYRALLAIWLASSLTMSAVDKEISHFYLLHFMLPIIALLGVWITFAWQKGGAPRWLLAGMAAALILVQASVLVSRIRQDYYHTAYLSSAAYLRDHMHPEDRVFGSAELAFELGFNGRLIDDYRLGYKTGQQARFVVLDQNRYQEWISAMRTKEPDAYRQIRDMLDHRYRMVYRDSEYEIYERTASSPPRGGAPIVPTYKEPDNIVLPASRIRKSAPREAIFLFVDGNSRVTPWTQSAALPTSGGGVHLMVRPGRPGYGSACRQAMPQILRERLDGHAIRFDADLSHPPRRRQRVCGCPGGVDGHSGRKRDSDLLRPWNVRELAPWRSLSGCRVENRLAPRPDESGGPSGPCREESLRHVFGSSTFLKALEIDTDLRLAAARTGTLRLTG